MMIEEFKNNVKKVTGKRVHKVTNSLGVYDAYKYYRRNRPQEKKYRLSESQYFNIVRSINNLIADQVVEGVDFNIPLNMGGIEIRKYGRTLSINPDGTVKNNLPIDWDKTLQLWGEDKSSYEEKKLIKVDSSEVFTVYYNRGKAKYKNKVFYKLNVNRKIKQRLKVKIRQGLVDALELAKRI